MAWPNSQGRAAATMSVQAGVHARETSNETTYHPSWKKSNCQGIDLFRTLLSISGGNKGVLEVWTRVLTSDKDKFPRKIWLAFPPLNASPLCTPLDASFTSIFPFIINYGHYVVVINIVGIYDPLKLALVVAYRVCTIAQSFVMTREL
jgi:hypothetical protein